MMKHPNSSSISTDDFSALGVKIWGLGPELGSTLWGNERIRLSCGIGVSVLLSEQEQGWRWREDLEQNRNKEKGPGWLLWRKLKSLQFAITGFGNHIWDLFGLAQESRQTEAVAKNTFDACSSNSNRNNNMLLLLVITIIALIIVATGYSTGGKHKAHGCIWPSALFYPAWPLVSTRQQRRAPCP